MKQGYSMFVSCRFWFSKRLWHVLKQSVFFFITTFYKDTASSKLGIFCIFVTVLSQTVCLTKWILVHQKVKGLTSYQHFHFCCSVLVLGHVWLIIKSEVWTLTLINSELCCYCSKCSFFFAVTFQNEKCQPHILISEMVGGLPCILNSLLSPSGLKLISRGEECWTVRAGHSGTLVHPACKTPQRGSNMRRGDKETDVGLKLNIKDGRIWCVLAPPPPVRNTAASAGFKVNENPQGFSQAFHHQDKMKTSSLQFPRGPHCQRHEHEC